MSRPRHAAPPRHRSAGQWAVIAFNAVACAVCLALAAGITWTWQRVREIPRIELSAALADETEGTGDAGTAQNFLIVGTDSADGLPEDDPIRRGRDSGLRTDTLMLVRVDPATEQAALLSIPRDLWVPIAGTRGSAKINSAFQSGGPGRLIATIKEALDLPVHHYVEVDFQGFKELVAAIDGVPMWFEQPARDENSGLYVPEAGCVLLDPDQALAYARARHLQLQDERGRWFFDPTGDLGRISRQQDFIRRALQRAFQRGARNPRVLRDLVEVGTQAVTLDGDLTPSDLLALGNRFRNFDPDNLVTYSLPVYDDVVGGAAVLRLRTTEAQPILDVFRGADPSRVAPDNTVVRVQNGTRSSGLGQEVAEGLRALGFVVPADNVGDAASFDVERTTVLYMAGAEERAALVARAIAADVPIERSEYIVGADVNVVIGADWPGLAPELREAVAGAPTTAAGATTTTTAPAPAAGGPTTTVIGEVPTTGNC